MQTPKEKATELCDRFFGELSFNDDQHKYISKQCALICTEEILGELYDMGIREEDGQRKFWYDVQKEIDNL